MVEPLWRTLWQFLIKTQQSHSYVLTHMNWKHAHTETCMLMFTVALSIITKNMEAAKLSNRWIKQTVLHPYNGVLFSNKRNRLLIHMIWMNQVKEVRPKTLHIVWFHSYDILEKSRTTVKIQKYVILRHFKETKLIGYVFLFVFFFLFWQG